MTSSPFSRTDKRAAQQKTNPRRVEPSCVVRDCFCVLHGCFWIPIRGTFEVNKTRRKWGQERRNLAQMRRLRLFFRRVFRAVRIFKRNVTRKSDAEKVIPKSRGKNEIDRVI